MAKSNSKKDKASNKGGVAGAKSADKFISGMRKKYPASDPLPDKPSTKKKSKKKINK